MRMISKLATFSKNDLPIPLPTPATNAAPVAVTTNATPAKAAETVVPATNTTLTTVAVPAPATTKPEPQFRLWHDHKGGVIKAKWIDTAKDGKSITLETEKGRRIRAVLHKFSEADRRYIKDNLK